MLQKEELVHGEYYKGSCRNASLARWNEKRDVFVYFRYKFGEIFLEDIKCYDSGSGYDEFKPYSLAEAPEEEIPLAF